MSKKHNLPSPIIYDRTKRYICTGDCNNPVEYHLVSIDIHIICSACIACKQTLDRMAYLGNGKTTAKSEQKEGKIGNLKVREDKNHGFYTLEFRGPPVSEFQATGMEWMKTYE